MTTVAFDLGMARLLAAASDAAYDRADDIEDASPQSVFPNAVIEWVESDLAHAYVATYADRQYVAFRGTEAPIDFLTDCRAVQVQAVGPGRSHNGFVVSAQTLWDRIRSRLITGLPAIFAGHSKGAAEATLAAYWASLTGVNVQCVYTFGSPRVFDPIAAAAYTLPTWRIVDADDIVPHLPLAESLIGANVWAYRHVGQFAHLQSGEIELGEPVWRELVEEMADFVDGQCVVSSHLIAKYRTALATAQGVTQ